MSSIASIYKVEAGDLNSGFAVPPGDIINDVAPLNLDSSPYGGVPLHIILVVLALRGCGLALRFRFNCFVFLTERKYKK